jgi:hypothetical protein
MSIFQKPCEKKKKEIYMDMLLKTPLNPMGKFKEKV